MVFSDRKQKNGIPCWSFATKKYYLCLQQLLSNEVIMRKIILLLFVFIITLPATAQELPQFSHQNFEGWYYNNPNVPLNSDNISQYRITIYVDSQGRVLTLTSPEFCCQGLDSIQATVTWKSRSIDIPLTMALDAGDGTPLDSVSCYPASASTANQKLSFTLPIPADMDTARVRFFSLQANVNNGGVIRLVSLTGIAGTPQETKPGDVDGNGRTDISDVTALINFLLTGQGIDSQAAADVNHDQRISIDDVTALIEILLTS